MDRKDDSGVRRGAAAWSDEQLDQWRLRWDRYQEDLAVVSYYHNIDQRRVHIQQELLQVLQSFLDENITAKAFNSAFQGITHYTKNVFSLRGMSGGMFFNKLIKYIADDIQLAYHLRSTLAVPGETRDGVRRMRSFVCFLDDLILQEQITKKQIQPSRVPFFLSVWWHLQDTKKWPICYPLVYQVVLSEASHLCIPEDSIDAYFVFRTRFLALAKRLGLSSWELEHLSTWYGQNNESARVPRRNRVRDLPLRRKQTTGFSFQEPATQFEPALPSPDNVRPLKVSLQEKEVPTMSKDDRHTHIQWLLAKLGHKVGCTVWIASNDHSKVWNSERLGDLSVSSLPLFADSTFQNIIRRIDVLWLQHQKVVAAYEIEHTTDIATGVLRLFDLGVLCSHTEYLCIVAPQERFRRIQFELSRPAFHIQELHEKCGLISEELLLEQETHILRWAGNLSVVSDLISRFDRQEEHHQEARQ